MITVFSTLLIKYYFCDLSITVTQQADMVLEILVSFQIINATGCNEFLHLPQEVIPIDCFFHPGLFVP